MSTSYPGLVGGSATHGDDDRSAVAGSGTEAAASFADLARAMVVPGSLTRTQRQVAELAVDVVPGCDLANLAAPSRRGDLHVVASTSTDVSTDASLPPSNGSWDVAHGAREVLAFDNVELERHSPGLAAWAYRHGIACMCTIPLATDRQALGVLNLYGVTAGALDEGARERASVFATHAALALDAAEVEARLSEAIATRQSIGQAVGILMERHDMSAGYAFTQIVNAAQSRRISIRALVNAIVTTGDDPLEADVGGSPDVGSPAPRGSVQPLSGLRHGFRLRGAIELANTRMLEIALDTMCATRERTVHLELAELDFISVPSVRAVIQAARSLGGQNRQLVLHDPPVSLTRILSVLLADRATLAGILVSVAERPTTLEPPGMDPFGLDSVGTTPTSSVAVGSMTTTRSMRTAADPSNLPRGASPKA